MPDKTKAKIPDVTLATEPWVRSQILDTENRIERAFHEQTQYLDKRMNDFRTEVRAEITEFRSEVRTDISDLRSSLMQTNLSIYGAIILIVIAIFIQPLLTG